MRVADVQKRVEEIRAIAYDYEAAHSGEDRLHLEVLEAIAVGASQAKGLASAALETREIKFARWCA
jgi:hypothetical protein